MIIYEKSSYYTSAEKDPTAVMTNAIKGLTDIIGFIAYTVIVQKNRRIIV